MAINHVPTIYYMEWFSHNYSHSFFLTPHVLFNFASDVRIIEYFIANLFPFFKVLNIAQNVGYEILSNVIRTDINYEYYHGISIKHKHAYRK